MKFFDTKFNKITDFEDLINFKVSRDINIEFFNASKVKISQSFENKFISTVAAFSNTIGGVIFLGIQSARKKAKTIDYISNPEITKKYLSNLISFNIKPFLDIEINEFKSKDGSLFAVKIKRSDIAPHMANDFKYYSRQADKTALMPEYEIRNIFSKNNKPELDFIGVINTGGIPTLSEGLVERMNFFPKFLIKNSGAVIERFYKVEISIPTALHDVSFFVLHDYFSRYDEEMTIFSISAKSPIFQNEIFTIAEAKLTLTEESYNIFENSSIEIKLFYSQGTKLALIDLKTTLLYNKQFIELSHFKRTNKIEQ